MQKSEVAFSRNVDENHQTLLANVLDVNRVEKHVKYLGFPVVIGCSKKEVFAFIKETLWKKAQGWKENFLSTAGREIMIKVVHQSIPTYIMSVYHLPDGLIEEIHALLARFWWGSSNSWRKIHYRAWSDLCRPKSHGGMGFRDLGVFNDALLARQGWRLLSNPESLFHSVL